MKKMIFSLTALFAAAVMFTACGSKPKFTPFEDKEKGFSIDVPEGMEKFDGPEAMGNTEFRVDGKTWNSLSVSVRENIMGDDYSKEYIDNDFNDATCCLTSDKSKQKKERTEDGWTCREEDDGKVWYQKAIFKGSKCYGISYYYETANAEKYGEETLKHVIESFKITK